MDEWLSSVTFWVLVAAALLLAEVLTTAILVHLCSRSRK